MNKKEIVYWYLNKHYKDVFMEKIVEFGNDMFSYTDRKGHKHIIRVVETHHQVHNDVKTVKYDDKYSLEIVTRKGI